MEITKNTKQVKSAVWPCHVCIQDFEKNCVGEDIMYLVSKANDWHQDIYLRLNSSGFEFIHDNGEKVLFDFDYENREIYNPLIEEEHLLLISIYRYRFHKSLAYMVDYQPMVNFEIKYLDRYYNFYLLKDSQSFITTVVEKFKASFTIDQQQDIIEDYSLDPTILSL